MTYGQLRPSIYISSMRAAAALTLSLFDISQVDAVSVLGSLNRDNGAVPDDQSAAVAAGNTGSGGEWGSVSRQGRERDGFTEGRPPYLCTRINWYRRQRKLLHSSLLWLQIVRGQTGQRPYLAAVLDKLLFIAGLQFADTRILSSADAQAPH